MSVFSSFRSLFAKELLPKHGALPLPLDDAELLDLWQELDAWTPHYIELERGSRALRQGGQASPFIGQGLEYMESTAYERGDEIRHLDWRLMAKTGEAFSKRFEAMRQPQWCLVFDVRASMWFGTKARIKMAQSIRMGALLAKHVQQMGASLHAWSWSDAGLQKLPLAGERNLAQSLVEQLNQRMNLSTLTDTVTPAKSLSQAGLSLAQYERLGTQMVLLSDFKDWVSVAQQDSDFIAMLAALAERFSLSAVQLYDPSELQLPQVQGIGLQAQSQTLWLDRAQDAAAYQAWANQHLQQTQELFARCGVATFEVQSDASFQQCAQRWQQFFTQERA